MISKFLCVIRFAEASDEMLFENWETIAHAQRSRFNGITNRTWFCAACRPNLHRHSEAMRLRLCPLNVGEQSN